MLSGAVEADIDSAGRILIPDFLKDFASLRPMWSSLASTIVWKSRTSGAWEAYKARIESEGDAMASKLGEIGVI